MPAPAAGLPSGASTRPRKAIISPSPAFSRPATTREARDPPSRSGAIPGPRVVATGPRRGQAGGQPGQRGDDEPAAAIALSRAIIMVRAACFIRTIVVVETGRRGGLAQAEVSRGADGRPEQRGRDRRGRAAEMRCRRGSVPRRRGSRRGGSAGRAAGPARGPAGPASSPRSTAVDRRPADSSCPRGSRARPACGSGRAGGRSPGG